MQISNTLTNSRTMWIITAKERAATIYIERYFHLVVKRAMWKQKHILSTFHRTILTTKTSPKECFYNNPSILRSSENKNKTLNESLFSRNLFFFYNRITELVAELVAKRLADAGDKGMNFKVGQQSQFWHEPLKK